MKDERKFDPVDPRSTTALDVLIGAVRDAVFPIVHNKTLAIGRHLGAFGLAVLPGRTAIVERGDVVLPPGVGRP